MLANLPISSLADLFPAEAAVKVSDYFNIDSAKLCCISIIAMALSLVFHHVIALIVIVRF